MSLLGPMRHEARTYRAASSGIFAEAGTWHQEGETDLKQFRNRMGTFVVTAALLMGTGAPVMFAQTAGQDIKDAGHDTKDAAKDTGHGVKKGTTKAWHGTKKGTEKAYDGTKSGTETAYDKTKSGTKKVVHKSANKTKEGADKVSDKTANPQ